MKSNLSVNLGKQIEARAGGAVIAASLAVKAEWESQAKSALKSTANTYISGINVGFSKKGGQYISELSLDGKLPVSLEKGYPSYDMKPHFATSTNVKRSKDGGWYATLPFRHTTPNATNVAGKNMPRPVYRQAVKLPQWGRLDASSAKPQTSSTGYQHKSSIHHGMQRSPDGQRSQYNTFRTVSSNSDPQAFIHPGFEGVNLMPKVAEKVPDIFMQVFNR
ncbi:hypothetical protein EalM132_00071 [Exiguobacterium phage vB_EalM-132]|nr:hypothetical protein EalM132_00071 [Exiguobacterium phage vB_EalM-132]